MADYLYLLFHVSVKVPDLAGILWIAATVAPSHQDMLFMVLLTATMALRCVMLHAKKPHTKERRISRASANH